MNALFDLATDRLVQTVESLTDTPINGRYIIPIPDGAAVAITATDTPESVASKAVSALLVRYPMYEYAAYNYFLNVIDMGGIDMGVTVPSPISSTKPRCMVGRGSGSPSGVSLSTVAIMPMNLNTVPTLPGLLVSNTIDISEIVLSGTDEVLVWWQIARYTNSTEIGASPTSRTITMGDQEPTDFSVYVSNDDGVTWYPVDRLLPVDLVNAGTNLRLAFVNTSSTLKTYLLGFALLYSGV